MVATVVRGEILLAGLGWSDQELLSNQPCRDTAHLVLTRNSALAPSKESITIRNIFSVTCWGYNRSPEARPKIVCWLAGWLLCWPAAHLAGDRFSRLANWHAGQWVGWKADMQAALAYFMLL